MTNLLLAFLAIAVLFLLKVGLFYSCWLFLAWVFNLWGFENYIQPFEVYQVIALLVFIKEVV